MIPIGDDTPRQKPAFVTWSLIAVNVVVFLACLSGGAEGFKDTLNTWGLTPAHLSPVTLLTSMFLHAGFFHIIGNMLYLGIFGDNVEDVFGHVWFLVFYLAMGLAAGLGHYASNVDSIIPTVGASGAISGVLGAYAFLFPRNRVRVLFWWYFYVRVFRISAGWMLGFYFILQLVMVFVAGGASNVAYWAHIGGFLSGLVITAVLVSLKVITIPQAPGAGRTSSRMRLVNEFTSREGPNAPDANVKVYGNGAGAYKVVSSGVADSVGMSAEPAARISAILAAVSSGEIARPVKATHLELGLPTKYAARPGALTRVADAFYHEKVYPVAFHVYSTFLDRAPGDDARIPEVEFRAGIIAARHLGDFTVAERLLADVVRRHESSERCRLAQSELDKVRANLVRTTIDEDGGLLGGPCAIIRQTSEMVNISRIGRLVSKAAGKPLADVTRLLKGSMGFVATGMEPVKAKILASGLQESGIPVLVVPEEKLIALPAAQKISWAAVREDGIELRTGLEGSGVVTEWDRIFYASAGKVVLTKRKRVVDGLAGGLGGRHYASIGIGNAPAVPIDQGPKWEFKEEKVETLIFDIFTLDPFTCLRCIDGKMGFRGSPQAVTMSSHLNFKHLVSDFLAFGRGVSTNEGVEFIAANASQRQWRRATFNSIRNFERYNYWRLQLEQYG